MKTKKYSLIIILLALSIFSCNAVDNLLTFNISANTSLTFPTLPTLPAGVPNENLNLPFETTTPEINSSFSDQLNNGNSSLDLVSKVKLKEIKLTIDPSLNISFGFLKSINLYISTTTNPEIEIGYLDNIVSTTNTINLIPTTSELVKYVKAPTYKIRALVIVNSIPANLSNSVIRNDMIFAVTAKPF